MGLFDSPEEKEKKRLYKMSAKWDDHLGVIAIGAIGTGTIIKYDTIKDVRVNEEVRIVTDTVGKTKKKRGCHKNSRWRCSFRPCGGRCRRDYSEVKKSISIGYSTGSGENDCCCPRRSILSRFELFL